MPQYTFNSNSIPLFNGEYYIQGLVTITSNESARTFTVALSGIRSYCKYGYNFSQNVQVWLNGANSSSGATSSSGKIAASGNNSYSGWIPSSGYWTGANISRTFSYNVDGSAPPVYFYLRAYNASVLWINQGTYNVVDVSATHNIGQYVPKISAEGPSSVSLSLVDYTATSITWNAKADRVARNYEVFLDSKSNYSSSMNGTAITNGKTTVSSAPHSIYVRMKGTASNWVSSNTISADCTIPPINNLRIDVDSVNSGTLHFTTTYNVTYTLKGSDGIQYASGSVNANKDPATKVTLRNNSSITYTLTISRKTINSYITNSKSTGNVDTRVATITLSGTAEGILFNFTATANYSCKNWYYVLQDTVTGNLTTLNYNTGVTTSTKYTLDELVPQRNYRLYVYATTNSSGLIATSNAINFKVNGCGRVYDGGKEKVVTVYIYDSAAKQWKQYVPYVWNGNEWVICV